MAITKISILQNDGTWAAAQPIGADSNDISIKSVTNQSLGNGETIASTIVLSTDTGTAAWNKHNKLCNAIDGLQSSLITSINTQLGAAAATMTTIQTNANSAIAGISTALNTAINSASTTLNNTFAPIQTNITLASGSTTWTYNSAENIYSQTITNNIFNTGSYVYWAAPTALNYDGIYMASIPVNNQAVFKTLTIPENNVTINIIRMKQGTAS